MTPQEVKNHIEVIVEGAEAAMILAREPEQGNILRNVIEPLRELIKLIDKGEASKCECICENCFENKHCGCNKCGQIVGVV